MDVQSRPPQASQLSGSDLDIADALLPTTSEVVLTGRDPAPGARAVLTRLYVSHTLSAWNSRMFEFGAVLFLASIFPATLLYASIYALVRALSAVALSSWLGDQVDKSDRLVALRQSIGERIAYCVLREMCLKKLFSVANKSLVWQRVPVAASCLCFIVLLSTPSWTLTLALFGITCVLACFEKLAATANTVAVERDWVCQEIFSLGRRCSRAWNWLLICAIGYCYI